MHATPYFPHYTVLPYINSAYFMETGYVDEAKTRFLSMGAYRDARQMAMECDYQKTKKLLANGDFARAKSLFGALGEYSDSPKMVLECDYQKAKRLLVSGKYDEAKSLFSQLADADYKDSETMVLETDYQNALALYKAFASVDDDDRQSIDIEKALSLLAPIQKYSDAQKLLLEVKDAIYDYAEYNFSASLAIMEMSGLPEDYESASDYYANHLLTAQRYFELIKDYSGTNQYLDLLDILKTDVSILNYVRLMEMWNFSPARRVILGNAYITYFLEGTWEGNDGYSFRLTRDSNGDVGAVCDIPRSNGRYFAILGLTYYSKNTENEWREIYRFSVLDWYTINIYAYKNGMTYRLVRQS